MILLVYAVAGLCTEPVKPTAAQGGSPMASQPSNPWDKWTTIHNNGRRRDSEASQEEPTTLPDGGHEEAESDTEAVDDSPEVGDGQRNGDHVPNPAPNGASEVTNSSHDGHVDTMDGRPSKAAQVETGKPAGSLRRELRQIHIFMIAISACIGMGVYVRTGVIYHMGGSGAVIYSFAFLGCVAFLIMLNLATMLSVWPIAGALIVFVEKFVDEEIGMTVGVLYWLTYCCSFAGLTTTLGAFADGVVTDGGKELNMTASIWISIISLLLPILFNLTDTRVFRIIEVVFGSIKIIIAVSITILMNAINPSDLVGGQPQTDPKNVTMSDTSQFASHYSPLEPRTYVFITAEAYGGWFGVLLTSIYLTSFAFVGVEAVAATAQEAKLKRVRGTSGKRSEGSEEELYEMTSGTGAPHTAARPDHSRPTTQNGAPLEAAPNHTHSDVERSDAQQSPTNLELPLDRTGEIFRGPALLVPLVATLIYVWAGWSVTQNINWDDPQLPSLNWFSSDGSSIFVDVGRNYDPPTTTSTSRLGNALTTLLIINVFSTSSTALFISSRTLFGLAYTLRKRHHDKPHVWWVRIARILSKKNKFDVPWVAVLVSAWLWWLPFTRYKANASIAIDVIVEMGSVSCIIVWAFESLAAFRFYGCYKDKFNNKRGTLQDLTSTIKINDKTWYLFHRITSGLAVALCVCIIFIGGGMTYSNNRGPLQGIAAFLIIGIFIALTAVLKILRSKEKAHGFWSRRTVMFVDLTDTRKVIDIFRDLDDHIKHNDEKLARPKMEFWDLGGIVNTEWISAKILRRGQTRDGTA
ncbi:amino acid permease-domain-containing protein [Xylariales sp. AK1849]|nr:amino acid permease-domain-containing protein [Xylariales sp. AK1849]